MDENNGHQLQITALADELHVSEDLVRMAVNESNGVLETARSILQNMLPRYLVVKARFVSPKSSGGSGVIMLIVKRDENQFLMFRTVYDDSRDWAVPVNVRQSPGSFLNIIKNYFKANPASSKVFDAEKLRKGLQPLQDIAALQFIFELWDRPKVDIVNTRDPAATYDDPAAILTVLLQKTLGEALLDSVDVTLDYDFYTEEQFIPIAEILKLKLETKSAGNETEESTENKKPEFQVTLRGQFLIDAINGTPVQNLAIGDQIYCEIIDKTTVAISLGRMIGVYKRGLWLPIKGRITDIESAESTRKSFTVAIARGVYLNVHAMEDLKIRTSGMTIEDRVSHAQEKTSEVSMIPILVGVALLAFQILILLLLR